MNKSLTFIVSIVFILHTHLLIAQDESDESESSQEESTAAESSVTNSATAPAASVSGAIEGNPIISMLRQGRSLEEIKQAIATFGLAGLQQKHLNTEQTKTPIFLKKFFQQVPLSLQAFKTPLLPLQMRNGTKSPTKRL
jgi:hypothetical protein